MHSSEVMEHLNNLYKDKNWFHSVGKDQYNRYVVYVKHMNHEILNSVLNKMSDVQVLVHFASSLVLNKDQYINTPSVIPKMFSPIEFMKFAVDFDQMLDSDYQNEVLGEFYQEEDLSVRHLENELTRLEKICGSNTLQDIFYEIRDAHNAVTNLSARYPDVRKALEKLYDQYGFDVIYENLDG